MSKFRIDAANLHWMDDPVTSMAPQIIMVFLLIAMAFWLFDLFFHI